MLAVSEARRLILEQCTPLPATMVSLADALGRVLAEPIVADLDVPPFDKSLMDGYAVRAADVGSDTTTLRILEEITAGRTPTRPLGPGQTSRIMTGAPLPEGCDAVVPIERTTLKSNEVVELRGSACLGDNVLSRGCEMRQGEIILQTGKLLRPQEIGMLATVGRTELAVVSTPAVAVLATGDELVEEGVPVGPGQIRNSNAPMLVAQVRRAGGQPRNLGIARDREDSLRPLIEEGLGTTDILILSGGVSAGKLDLVPDVLRQADVVAHFHKIAMKPGKPLFFGTVERSEGKRLVFGLPGNPVSSFVCFELFVRPALRRLAGMEHLDLPSIVAEFESAFTHQSDRPTYYPATVQATSSGWQVKPVPWFGSSDLRAFVNANALLALPVGSHSWKPGDTMTALLLDT